MIIHAIFFYLFAGITVASAVMVIAARNPVHSVLFLILAFVNAAGLFVLLGAEFLAMILIVVYVGAVAVLFLFVVMMLDVDFAELRQGFSITCRSARWSAPCCWRSCWSWSAPGRSDRRWRTRSPRRSRRRARSATRQALGLVLYTRYVYFFQAAGLILLVAMVGAIVMTLQHKPQRQAAKYRRASCPPAHRRDRYRQGEIGARSFMKDVRQ